MKPSRSRANIERILGREKTLPFRNYDGFKCTIGLKAPSQYWKTLKATAYAHVQAYSSSNPWDETTIWKLRRPDYIHYLHPTDSIPEPFNGPIGQYQHRYFKEFFDLIFDECRFEVKDCVVDTENKTVVLKLSATFDFKAFADEPGEKGWLVDYMWLTEMDESGKRL